MLQTLVKYKSLKGRRDLIRVIAVSELFEDVTMRFVAIVDRRAGAIQSDFVLYFDVLGEGVSD